MVALFYSRGSMNSGVYEILNTVNGKRYVGSAVDMSRRFRHHRNQLTRGRHHSRHLQASWNKNGAEAFALHPLLICAEAELLFFEQRALDVFRPEFNSAPHAGNALGVKHTAEARANMARAKLGNKHTFGYRHTPETLLRMSNAKKGNTATKGKKRNPEAVAKTAAAHRGMKRSKETRRRISLAMTGKKRSPKSSETRAKLSAALRGRSTLSPEATARMAATKRGQKLTADHRANIGAGSRAAWALRKHGKPQHE